MSQLEEIDPETGVARRWGKKSFVFDPVFVSKFKSRPTDIFIASPAKCGTTWLQNILFQLHHRGKANLENIFDSIPWMDIGGQLTNWGSSVSGRDERHEYFERLSDPRMFKTHCRWEQLPWVEGSKTIISIRDPRDVCVSMYHHIKDLTDDIKQVRGINPDTFCMNIHFQQWMTIGEWFSAVKSWWAQRNRSDVLILRYELMLADPRTMLNQIIDFLQWDLSEEERVLVLDKISFSWMKDNVDKFNRFSKDSNAVFKEGGFIRKGVAGDHQTLLTSEQRQAILDRARSELEPECLEFLHLQ